MTAALVILLFSGFGKISYAAAPDPVLIKECLKSDKLHRSDHVLKDFYNKKSTTSVIVRLSTPKGYVGAASLRKRSNRPQTLDLMRTHTQKTIKKLDAGHVRVISTFGYQPGFVARVSLTGLKQITGMSDIIAIEKDEPLYPHDVQGLNLMNGATMRSVYNGQGAAIAICDTGIDYTHAMLGNGSFPNNKVIGGYNVADNTSNPMDLNGHGTNCAGIAAGSLGNSGDYNGGVAYSAKLYAVKITSGSSGNSSISAMISAWEWCITHQYDNASYPILIISTSFGGASYTAACDSVSPSMTQAANSAVAAGMTLFASSGNDGYCNAIAFPSCIACVNSVGAVLDANIGGVGFCVTSDSCAANKQTYSSCYTGYVAWLYSSAADMVVPSSNTSSFMTMLAPSKNAYTTALGGGYTSTFGGTSAACPYAAGAAACIQSAAKAATGSFLTPATLKSRMLAAGDPVAYAAAGISKPRVNLWKIDSDGDSMPDGWEITCWGDVNHTSAGDDDHDNLTNLQEYSYGTNPTTPDSDGDGYNDDVEISIGTNPLDAASYPNPVPAMGPLSILIAVGLIVFLLRYGRANKL